MAGTIRPTSCVTLSKPARTAALPSSSWSRTPTITKLTKSITTAASAILTWCAMDRSPTCCQRSTKQSRLISAAVRLYPVDLRVLRGKDFDFARVVEGQAVARKHSLVLRGDVDHEFAPAHVFLH